MALDEDVIIDRFNAAEDAMDQRHNEWLDFYELYRCYRQRDTNAFSNLFVPETFISIEQVLPRLVSAIVSASPTASVHPLKPSDVESAKLIEQLHNYQLNKMQFKRKLTPTLKSSLIFGTGVMKSQWTNQMIEVDGQKTEKYAGPSLDYVSPFDIMPDPHASSKDDADYIMQQYFVTKKTLEDWERKGKVGTEANGQPISDVTSMSRRRNSNRGEDWQERKLNTIGKRTGGSRDTTRDWVWIVEYWDSINDRFAMVANQNNLIKNEDNPYWANTIPFFFFRDYPLGDEFWGMGEVEVIQDLQEEINTQRNQRIDARSLSLNPILQVSQGAMIENDEIVFEPGRIWRTEPGAVQPFAIPDTGTASVEEEQIASQNIKEAVSVTDVIRGQQGTNFPETATGVNTLDTNASTRFNMKVRNYEEPLQNMFEHQVMMNQQNIDRERVIRVTGELPDRVEKLSEDVEPYKFLKVQPQDVPNFYDYEIRGAESITKIQRQQRFIQLLQIGSKFTSEFNVKETIRRLFESMEVEDVDRLMTVPQEQIERMQEIAKDRREQARDLVEGQADGTQADNAGNQPRPSGETGGSAEQELLNAARGGTRGGASGGDIQGVGPVRVQQ